MTKSIYETKRRTMETYKFSCLVVSVIPYHLHRNFWSFIYPTLYFAFLMPNYCIIFNEHYLADIISHIIHRGSIVYLYYTSNAVRRCSIATKSVPLKMSMRYIGKYISILIWKSPKLSSAGENMTTSCHSI